MPVFVDIIGNEEAEDQTKAAEPTDTHTPFQNRNMESFLRKILSNKWTNQWKRTTSKLREILEDSALGL